MEPIIKRGSKNFEIKIQENKDLVVFRPTKIYDYFDASMVWVTVGSVALSVETIPDLTVMVIQKFTMDYDKLLKTVQPNVLVELGKELWLLKKQA